MEMIFFFVSFVTYYIFKKNTIQGTILIIIHTFTELLVSSPPLFPYLILYLLQVDGGILLSNSMRDILVMGGQL